MAFQDKDLVCRDCGKKFTFTAGEQEFYLSRGWRVNPLDVKSVAWRRSEVALAGLA
jgi:hypothetical protein